MSDPFFVECHDDGIFPLLRHLVPTPKTNDDIGQFPAQGGITVEGNLEQLNGDSVRSNSLSVRQRADGVCQLMHRELSVMIQSINQSTLNVKSMNRVLASDDRDKSVVLMSDDTAELFSSLSYRISMGRLLWMNLYGGAFQLRI